MESTRSDPELDDDFSEIYKEYTGPVINNIQEKEKPIKRIEEECDEEEQLPDPNSVPTDFTSREAKVWEAKSKATERNWKKRKEEEMICKICGESGHFTQGCPTTLGGANGKSQEFLERVPARDKNVRVLFTEKVMERIERETGCKLRMDEKFLIVSGKDRLILRKGVDAVHKVKENSEMKTSSTASHRSRSRSPPRRTSVGPPRTRNYEPQRQNLPSSHGSSSFLGRPGRQDKFVDNRIREENRVRDNQQNFPRGSPQAYGSERARSRSTQSKSPGRPRYSGWDKPYDRQKSEVSGYRSERWDQERIGGGGGGSSDNIQVSHQFERPAFSQTLEEVELEYTRDAMELEKKRDKEEDDENNKHRETLRELRESYMKKLAGLRGINAKEWEEFLEVDSQRRQQQARQQISGYGSSNYRQFPYSEFDDGYSANQPPPPSSYGGNNVPMNSEGRYPNHVKNYSSRHQDNSYGTTGFQRQRREDYGKAYNRY